MPKNSAKEKKRILKPKEKDQSSEAPSRE